MSGKGEKKSKRRRRDKDDDDDVVRGSGVDYSKVADRHVDDERFEKHKQSAAGSTPSAVVDATPAASGAAPVAQPKVSSQMAAVMRLMAGMEERTIAQKLADSNRPTWEQYKKDNEDKLDLVGADMKKMEAYRKELDEQREKLLTRGTNHKKEGGKEDKKSSKKKKRKKHRRHEDSYSSESDSSGDNSSDDDSRRDRKRKKHKKRSSSSKHNRKKSSRRHDSDSYDSDDERKKSSKHKREKDKKKDTGNGDSSDGDGYRLSSFFANGSDDESR